VSRLGYKEVGDDSGVLQETADVPEAIVEGGCTKFQIETMELRGQQRMLTSWNAFFLHDQGQFYISAPTTVSASSKQSLVSLLELAECLNCSCAWLYIDRQHADFMAVVSMFKYLGFQLSQSTVKDSKANKMYALLRYELD
jgi:hypothetical protein